MVYAVNIKKGTTLQNPDIGELKGGVAIPITDKQALIAKHLINVVVFDTVAGIKEDKVMKGLYGISKETLEKHEEMKTYQDFVSKYKDVKEASKRWEEYKQEMGR